MIRGRGDARGGARRRRMVAATATDTRQEFGRRVGLEWCAEAAEATGAAQMVRRGGGSWQTPTCPVRPTRGRPCTRAVPVCLLRESNARGRQRHGCTVRSCRALRKQPPAVRACGTEDGALGGEHTRPPTRPHRRTLAAVSTQLAARRYTQRSAGPLSAQHRLVRDGPPWQNDGHCPTSHNGDGSASPSLRPPHPQLRFVVRRLLRWCCLVGCGSVRTAGLRLFAVDQRSLCALSLN